VERVAKALMALGLGYWIYVVMPHRGFTRWGWLVIAAGAAGIVAVFSRRLIYWHSEWQNTMREVLADRRPDRGEARANARAALGEGLGAWNLTLADSPVPDAATYAGRTLAELGIPARFGCTVVEVDRNGHAVAGLGPETAVFPGDRLLLLGEPAQVAVAREFLNQEMPPAQNPEAFENAILDHCRVAGPRIGQTLAELQVARRTAVRIVGIQRGDRRIINPTGSERLEEGDALLLLGTLAQIRRFRQWLADSSA
jgi:CPA2 family monovalent cation:H+ antiporter-2